MPVHLRSFFLAALASAGFTASLFPDERAPQLLSPVHLPQSGITFQAPARRETPTPRLRYGGRLGVGVFSVTPAEANRLRQLRTQLGGGADVTGLTVLQTAYTNIDSCGFGQAEASPAIVLDWEERLHNSGGVDVFMDGELLETVDGLADDNEDGCVEGILPQNNCQLVNVPPGSHAFRVEPRGEAEGGVEATHVVFEEPPFCNVETASCTTVETNGVCALSIEWTNGGPSPTVYNIEFGDSTGGSVPGGNRSLDLGLVPPANSNIITIVGIEEVDGGFYQDRTFDLECLINCEVSCAPPGEPTLAQVAYGPTNAERSVRAFWVPGQDYDDGNDVFVDGDAIGTGLGNPSAIINGFAVGEHTVGVRGNCAALGTSITVEGSFDVLEESPITAPTLGPVTCRFSMDENGQGMTRISWTNARPHTFIEAYVPGSTQPGLRLSGCTTEFFGLDTTPTSVFELQFFDTINGHVYGSERIVCEPEVKPIEGTRFVRGVCDGQGSAPQLTTAVFGLNFLFLGGDEPPCRRACDTDGDGEFIISDMVNLLNFLFLGGTSPNGWADADGDGRLDPLCESSTEDCTTENPSCPL